MNATSQGYSRSPALEVTVRQQIDMDDTDTPRMRKRMTSDRTSLLADSAGEIDLASHATLAYASEDPAHPLEHLIDRHFGPGATRWASARPDVTEYIVLEFDHAQRVSRIIYEAEECLQERTQEVRVEVWTDHVRAYRQVLAHDYTFRPQVATFDHQDVQLDLPAITHLRLTVVPNKGGSGTATLTSLRLFA
jgi:F5/8 type C domain-containing protein